jgi:phosphatidylglycerol:prolipoprotein diacylglycerol transferase
MLPTLHLLGRHVVTYDLLLTLYLAVALLLTMRLARRGGTPPRVVLGVFALAAPAGLLGARLLDALEYPDRYPDAAALVGPGAGSSIFGAFVVAGATAAVYLRLRGVSCLRVLDAGAPAMALGEAVTRIGCFLNGCCYGVPTSGPLAVRFPRESFAFGDQVATGLVSPAADATLAVHPVQLYSVAAMAVVAILLAGMLRRAPTGATVATFLVAYGVLRLAMAPLRAEALRSMTAFSVTFVVVGAGGFLAAYRRARALRPRGWTHVRSA